MHRILAGGNPIKPVHPDFSGLGPLVNLAHWAGDHLAAVMLVVAVIAIIVGGAMMMWGGSRDNHRRGLHMIQGAIVGTVVILAAGWIIAELSNISIRFFG